VRIHRGSIRPIRPRGPLLEFKCNPESVLRSRQPTWNRISRPRRSTALSYGGMGEETLTFDLIFDGVGRQNDVEHRIQRLTELAVPSGQEEPPPVIKLHYGRMGAGKEWVVDSISEGEEQRDRHLARIYYQATITLVEHIGVQADLSHAASHRRRQGGRGRSHRVIQGESLSAIAARQLGDASRSGEIAALNDIRDGRNIAPGTVLRMPS
jgi:hypothetical protein